MDSTTYAVLCLVAAGISLLAGLITTISVFRHGDITKPESIVPTALCLVAIWMLALSHHLDPGLFA